MAFRRSSALRARHHGVVIILLPLLLLCPSLASARADGPVAAWPGGARADLVPPDSLWRPVLERVHRSGRPLGYTSDEMASFGRDALILRPVRNLFRDARSATRFSGKTAEDLIANAADPVEIEQRAFALTDVSSGRMLPLPDSTSWGVDWIPRNANPSAALDAVLRHEIHRNTGRITEADRRAWNSLPEPLQRLVIRVMLGAIEAAPWFESAFEDPVYDRLREQPAPKPQAPTGRTARYPKRGRGAPAPTPVIADTAGISDRYRFATAPWTDLRVDQSATRSRRSIEALSRLDRDYLDFAGAVFLSHLRRGLREFHNAGPSAAPPPAGFRGCRFDTPLGPAVISGFGADTLSGPVFLRLDPGGDDLYLGRQGIPLSLSRPIGVVIDLDGNDSYEGGAAPVSLGSGLFGLGGIFDLGGNDRYRCGEAGLGYGCYGIGLVVDSGGDDVYVLDRHDGEGAALAGIGVLADLAGNDSYTCGFAAQGFGETLGAGVLVDVSGDDVYLARDDGNPDPLYNNQSVSMAQGAGQGRRADLGDGHSLAGGIGFLVDGAGDDSYHATAWSQGAGYWWSAGFLEDLGGNDRYRNGKYSLGAAAHFAVGCQVDLSGNDEYNVGNEAVVNQYQGHARDGSIGISVDGDGDDRYSLRSHCGGSGDLNSIGLFWDRRGNDRYEVDYTLLGAPDGWTDTPPLGSSTLYTPFRSFRDDTDAIGLFLDTGGKDEYLWKESPVADSLRALGAVPQPADGREWPSHRGSNAWGLGMDLEFYPPAR